MARYKASISKDGGGADINISPLIDMVFILLIFFIVTTTFVEEKGFAAETPTPSSAPPSSDEERISLVIKKTGQIYIQHIGEEIETNLTQLLFRVKREMLPEPYPILITVDSESIMDLYVSAHDACLSAGAESVTIKVGP